jgi:hypothetical protein
VEVLEPASLRKVIKESIMKMAKLYAWKDSSDGHGHSCDHVTVSKGNS